MPKYSVPVTCGLTGEIVVEADNVAEALEKAKDRYIALGREVIDCTTNTVDFAYGEILGAIAEIDD